MIIIIKWFTTIIIIIFHNGFKEHFYLLTYLPQSVTADPGQLWSQVKISLESHLDVSMFVLMGNGLSLASWIIYKDNAYSRSLWVENLKVKTMQ